MAEPSGKASAKETARFLILTPHKASLTRLIGPHFHGFNRATLLFFPFFFGGHFQERYRQTVSLVIAKAHMFWLISVLWSCNFLKTDSLFDGNASLPKTKYSCNICSLAWTTYMDCVNLHCSSVKILQNLNAVRHTINWYTRH